MNKLFVDACGIERDISGEYSVTFKGFKSLKDAELFSAWFSNEGEQDADYCFVDRGEHIYGTCGIPDVLENTNLICSLYATKLNG